MPLIARTDGALSGEPIELRDGVLTDIPDTDRVNWRVVDESAAPPITDRFAQVKTTPLYTIQGDGSVAQTWAVASYPAAYQKKLLKDYVRGVRKRHLQAGLRVQDYPIRADRDKLLDMLLAMTTLQIGPIDQIEWKFDNGEFVTLDFTQMQALYRKVAKFVQDAFKVEKQLRAAIDAGTVTTQSQIDNAPWPS